MPERFGRAVIAFISVAVTNGRYRDVERSLYELEEVVECTHATTRAWLVTCEGAYIPTDEQVVTELLLRRTLEGDCNCADDLWARYGPRMA